MNIQFINIIAADSEDILILRLYSRYVASDNTSQVFDEHVASSCFQFDNELTSILTFSMYSILPYILGYHFAKLIH